MKRILISGLCLAISLIVVVTASASTIGTLSIGGPGSVPQYGNPAEYVGPIGANLDGVGITRGITCLDFRTTTWVPNDGFSVYVGTLDPVVDLSHAKFASQTNALFEYQEAAWLLGQMANNPNDIGAIQFAIWRIFDSTASSGASSDNVARENYWMGLAAGINPAAYDFSSVRIYTPTNTTNQEFMSGAAADPLVGATGAPLPGAAWLLGSGLLCLLGFRKKFTG